MLFLSLLYKPGKRCIRLKCWPHANEQGSRVQTQTTILVPVLHWLTLGMSGDRHSVKTHNVQESQEVSQAQWELCVDVLSLNFGTRLDMNAFYWRMGSGKGGNGHWGQRMNLDVSRSRGNKQRRDRGGHWSWTDETFMKLWSSKEKQEDKGGEDNHQGWNYQENVCGLPGEWGRMKKTHRMKKNQSMAKMAWTSKEKRLLFRSRTMAWKWKLGLRSIFEWRLGGKKWCSVSLKVGLEKRTCGKRWGCKETGL